MEESEEIGSDELVPNGPDGRLCAALDTQFDEYVRRMAFHRMVTDGENSTDLDIGKTVRHQAQDLGLPFGKRMLHLLAFITI
jgi:hypothetical protein